MRPERGRSLGLLLLLMPLCAASGGCGLFRPKVDQSLLAHQPDQGGPERVADAYVVQFPDVIEIRVSGQPALSGERPVRIDGRFELAPGTPVRAEGKTTAAIEDQVADLLDLPPEKVSARVVRHNSQRIYLQGEIRGGARAVSYVGPESVLDMLQRVGGVTAGAEPADVQVVRAHVAAGKPPEVFDVDLEAILHKNDHETNLKLRPFDQVYVGQSRTSCIKECLPPWLRPLFDRLCGMSRPDDMRERTLRRRRATGLAGPADIRYMPPHSK